MSLQSFPPVIFQLFSQLMSVMNGKASTTFIIKVVCLALKAIMKDQVEQLNKTGVAVTAIDIDKEPESVRSDIYTFGSLFSVILTFRFAGFGTSVICHVVFIPFLGSFLLQSLSIGFRKTKFEIFCEHVSN